MSNNENKRQKRDHGEGSITLRKDGKWTARVQLGTKADGKPKIKAIYGKSESEVKRKLKEFKKNINNLPSEAVRNLSIETYILNWLYTYKRNILKPASFDRVESTIKNHILPNIGFLKIATLRQDDIQGMFNDMYNKGLSHSSIKKAKDALNSCFKHAIIRDDIIKNPMLGTSIPSLSQFSKKEITFFSKEEISNLKTELFRKYKTSKRVYVYSDAYILILNTGLRMGEALSLKWTDVDFDKKIMRIQRNLILAKKRNDAGEVTAKGYNLVIQDTTKSYAGERIIHLNANALQALENLKKPNKNYEYIMTNTNGNIIPPHNFDRTFYRALENTGLKKCGVHSLRHTFASMLFQNGVDVKTVSELLGHSDITITYNTYIHLIKEQKANAVNLIVDM